MGQKKLFRFAEIKTFKNVLEYPENMKGKWNAFFKNENPIIIELACGRGEYTVSLARLHPEKNFIGIDVKGNRMYIGAKRSLDENLANAAFLRTQIEQLTSYFEHAEVAEIWITFPDPQLRLSKAKKRLTHPRFLRLYKEILKEGGLIHLKTDSPDLYAFTLQVIDLFSLPLSEYNDDIYAGPVSAELNIKTHYESLDIAGSKRIHYIRFGLPKELPEKDEQLKQAMADGQV